MNSALKPVLSTPVPQPGGQGSPAKANVAAANHSVALPQGAQNTLHIGTNNLVGQNLTHHAPPPPLPSHAIPSMAPVSANMAQMAQNMSHHGNLSHVSQNSVTPANTAASPVKSASSTAPLSLVAQEKAPTVSTNPSQPLALTRTEKKEPDATGQSNGTAESPKSAASAPAALKAQNPEVYNDKPDIAKTSPSTPKPPEKPASAPSTPQKPDTPQVTPATPASSSTVQADGPSQPKVATANEPPEKSPSKPSEPKAPSAPTADVAPTQSDNKPVQESAKDSQCEKPLPAKAEPIAETPKPESAAKPDTKKESEVEKPAPKPSEEKKEEAKPAEPEPVKKEEPVAKAAEKPVEKVEEKKPEKVEVKTPVKLEVKAIPKSTLKLATVTPPIRKRRQVSPKIAEGATPAKKPHDGESTPDTRTKRNRTQVQLYQSPTPELTMATKLSASAGRSTPPKQNDDKLIVFYKNEYLAVRNAEGGFYVCQAMQNVYRTTRKIKIRWLSQDKTADPSGETYKPDFYDVTDMECVLTTLSLAKAGGGGAMLLRAAEAGRARSILQRALAPHSALQLTEEHPDGLDLSLYKDESQLEKKSRKRSSSKASPRAKASTDTETATPAKRSRPTPKRSPKSSRKSKQNKTSPSNKRPITQGTTAPASKTATAVTEKSKVKVTNKRTPVKAAKVETPEQATPLRKGRRSESKPTPIVPTPSTSTGKTTRTPRKPPAKK